MTENNSTYTITVAKGRKVLETIVTRCHNQETAHGRARRLVYTLDAGLTVSLVNPAGEAVERWETQDDTIEGKRCSVWSLLTSVSSVAASRAARGETKQSRPARIARSEWDEMADAV